MLKKREDRKSNANTIINNDKLAKKQNLEEKKVPRRERWFCDEGYVIVIGDGLVRILVLTHAEEETWRWDSNMEGPSYISV